MTNSSEILTGAELKALTGTADSAKQKQNLVDNRIHYILDVKGRPVVLWGWVRDSAAGCPARMNEPNFQVLTNAAKATSR